MSALTPERLEARTLRPLEEIEADVKAAHGDAGSRTVPEYILIEEDIPALVAEVRRLQKENETMRGYIHEEERRDGND